VDLHKVSASALKQGRKPAGPATAGYVNLCPACCAPSERFALLIRRLSPFPEVDARPSKNPTQRLRAPPRGVRRPENGHVSKLNAGRESDVRWQAKRAWDRLLRDSFVRARGGHPVGIYMQYILAHLCPSILTSPPCPAISR
jgi:hypothetical protein